MTENQKQRKINAMKEFEEIVQTYIIPLLDIKGNCKIIERNFNNKSYIEMEKDSSDVLNIFPLVSRKNIPSPFYIQVKLNGGYKIPKSLYRILAELIKVSEYNYYDFSIKRYYGKDGKRQLSYKKEL